MALRIGFPSTLLCLFAVGTIIMITREMNNLEIE